MAELRGVMLRTGLHNVKNISGDQMIPSRQDNGTHDLRMTKRFARGIQKRSSFLYHSFDKSLSFSRVGALETFLTSTLSTSRFSGINKFGRGKLRSVALPPARAYCSNISGRSRRQVKVERLTSFTKSSDILSTRYSV